MSLKYELELATPDRYAGGTNRRVTSDNIPELVGVSLSSTRIEPGGLREVHWHNNANELNYCLKGEGQIELVTFDGSTTTFPIRAGSVTFIPEGSTHYILNTGCETLHMLVAFSVEKAEHIDISNTLGFVPRAVMAQTFSIPTSSFPHLPRQGDQFLVKVDDEGCNNRAAIPPQVSGGPFTVNLEDIPPQVFAGGIQIPVTTEQIPSLKDITMFYLQGLPGALREPHWHPEAGELHYFVSGKADMQVQGPNGERERFIVEAGDVGFAPLNYLHYVRSISDEPIIFLGFYSNNRPGNIDISQTFSTFPHELLAASFSSNIHIFDDIPNRGDVLWAPPQKEESTQS